MDGHARPARHWRRRATGLSWAGSAVRCRFPRNPGALPPFVASIDLAALPGAAAGLPLPPDGHLLLVAFSEDDGDRADMGEVGYMPAVRAVEERDKDSWAWFETEGYRPIVEAGPQGGCGRYPVSPCPRHRAVELPAAPHSAPLPGHLNTLDRLVRRAARAAEAGVRGGGSVVSAAGRGLDAAH
ncbi:hypothetical protein [Marinitenerispora sediminis]|uniref:hypothetical protein n=1 Tax=Marinitenerispora sediminis TaxID=1931232 RepID=UPI0015F1BAC4|nr:hypothetical protein [Marinitenerispora sediminis]